MYPTPKSEAASFAHTRSSHFRDSRVPLHDLRATSPQVDAFQRQQDKHIREEAEAQAHALRSRAQCGRGAVIVAEADGSRITIVPTRCKTWFCPHCGPILARLWGDRIAHAKPERFITLTADPNRWPRPDLAYDAIREAWPKLVRLIRQRIGPFEYALVWELHASGYPHLHVCQRGSYIPQKWLSAQWDALGIGSIVDIRSISTHRGAARYATKYMLKTVTTTAKAFTLHRVVTASRHFFTTGLIKYSPAKSSKTITAHTMTHPADVARLLIGTYGYTLVPPAARGPIVLMQSDIPASHTPIEAILLAFTQH